MSALQLSFDAPPKTPSSGVISSSIGAAAAAAVGRSLRRAWETGFYFARESGQTAPRRKPLRPNRRRTSKTR